LSDLCLARDFRTCIYTQCIFGRWGHSVENCQQMAMHFLIVNYLQKYANMESAGQISERWRLTNKQYSQSARSTAGAIRSTMPKDMAGRTDDEIMEKLYNEDDALSDFSLSKFSVVTENERLCLPINQNIMSASPYLVVHTVHRVQKPARPMSLPAPNIQHQAQCDPGANISATNNINVLRDTVALESQFPISIANHTAPYMMASVCGTFVLPSDGSTCNIPMYYFPSLADTIVSLQHFTSSTIPDRQYNGYCIIDIPG
jgi:hypothetical protein